jgi:2'-5' RNA ligase superfamily
MCTYVPVTIEPTGDDRQLIIDTASQILGGNPSAQMQSSERINKPHVSLYGFSSSNRSTEDISTGFQRLFRRTPPVTVQVSGPVLGFSGFILAHVTEVIPGSLGALQQLIRNRFLNDPDSDYLYYTKSRHPYLTQAHWQAFSEVGFPFWRDTFDPHITLGRCNERDEAAGIVRRTTPFTHIITLSSIVLSGCEHSGYAPILHTPLTWEGRTHDPVREVATLYDVSAVRLAS